jgi:hypothetical protein
MKHILTKEEALRISNILMAGDEVNLVLEEEGNSPHKGKGLVEAKEVWYKGKRICGIFIVDTDDQ